MHFLPMPETKEGAPFPSEPVSNPCSPSLRSALTKLLESRRNSGRRHAYLQTLRQHLEQFIAGREEERISDIRVDAIAAWVHEPSNLWSRSTRLSRVSSLFQFAVRQRWIQFNPCDQIDRISIDLAPPRILTVGQSSTLMHWVLEEAVEALPWFALGLFAGLRPTEADRLTWTSVRADVVVVDSAASKVRRRRIIQLEPTAIEWLDAARSRGRLPMPYSTRRKAMRRARHVLGFGTWPADILRHTFASYWYAAHNDAAKLAAALGNSEAVLMRHYRELATSHDAATFWSITPRQSPPDTPREAPA